MMSFVAIVLAGELRRKSVLVTAAIDGFTVGSEIDRPCIVDPLLIVPRSVRVFGDFSP